MEQQSTNNNQLSKTSSNHSSEVVVVKKVSEATEVEITMQLAYIMVLVGIPEAKYPQGSAKNVMLSYIKMNWSHTNLDEMKDAFQWAIETRPCDKKGNSLITLYDRPFNIEYIKSIITAYRLHKNKEAKHKPEEEGMTNHKRAEGIIGMIAKQNPELYEKLKSIGKEKPPPAPEQNKTTQDIKGVFKQYELEYNKLWQDQCMTGQGSFVKYEEKMYNFSEYCNHRYGQDHLEEITEEEQQTESKDPEDILP